MGVLDRLIGIKNVLINGVAATFQDTLNFSTGITATVDTTNERINVSVDATTMTMTGDVTGTAAATSVGKVRGVSVSALTGMVESDLLYYESEGGTITHGQLQGDVVVDDPNLAVTVRRIDGVDVDLHTIEPSTNDHLAFDGASWVPQAYAPDWSKRRIMMVGDSMTASPTGRSALGIASRARQGVHDFVGPFVTPTPYSTTDYALTQTAHDGRSGYRIDQVTPLIASDIAGSTPDLICVQLGTNDIGADETGSSMLTQIGALVDAITATGFRASRVILSTIPPWNATADDAPTRAAREAQRVIYNAGLAAVCSTKGCVFANVGGSLSISDLAAADGVHPSEAVGYPKWGQAWASAIAGHLVYAPSASRLVPRSFATHAPMKCLRFDSTDYVNIANHANNQIPVSGSFAIAFWMYVDSLDSIRSAVTYIGGAWPDVVTICPYDADSRLNVYAANGTAKFEYLSSLVAGAWYRVVLVADADAGTLQLWLNGTRYGEVTTTWAFTTGGYWRIGANGTFNPALAVICDMTICHAGSTYFRVPTAEDIYNDYYDSVPGAPTLPGVCAYYGMHEGTGSSVADSHGGTSGTVSGAAWVDISMPGG